MLFRILAGRLPPGLAIRCNQTDRDSRFLDGIGHAAQFLILFLQLAEIRVLSRKFAESVLQIGIEGVDVPGIITFGCQQDGLSFVLV